MDRKQLAAIWESVLPSTARPGDEDTFVGLGGDSVAATICLIKIRRACGVELSYTTLLSEQLTFREFADMVGGLAAAPNDAGRR